MPIYESRCQTCGKDHTYLSKVADCLTSMPECCGQKTHKVILTAPPPPQFDDLNFRLSSGEYVKTKQERKEVMARNGYVEAQPIEDWKRPEQPELSVEEIKEVRDQMTQASNF